MDNKKRREFSKQQTIQTKDDEIMQNIIELNDNKRIDTYISGMQDYIQSLKAMKPKDAKKESRKNLLEAGIITKNGTIRKEYRSDK